MVPLFRRDRGEELELLRSTVAQLGEATVEGLAAALGWRRRTTERWLAEELRRPGTPLVYDARQGTVRWAAEEDAAEVPPAFEPPSFAPRIELAPPAPAPPADLPPIRGTCSSCHVPLHPATNGAFAVCPRCGRLSSRRSLEASSSGPPAPFPAPRDGAAPVPVEDRRLQEMLAAYVTSQPILCPRCRTPLRHRSLAEYVCPTCGREVRFPGTPPSGVAARGSGAAPPTGARPAGSAEPVVAAPPGRYAAAEPGGDPDRSTAAPPATSARSPSAPSTLAAARVAPAAWAREPSSAPRAPRRRRAPSSHAPSARPRAPCGAPTRAHR
jgi:predicted RNA-binding Zn-ribbon protein involved in translation (DUF1610 family)